MSEIHDKIISYFLNKENPIILDLGCYLMEDLLIFSNKFPNSKCYGFEADPRNINYIKKFIQLPENVTLVEGAIGNSNHNVSFWPSNDIDFNRPYTLSGSIKRPTGHLNEYTVRFGNPFEVTCQTLDNWYKNSDIYNQVIDFQWIDLNGAEKEYLDGSTAILKKTRLIYIECFDKELYEGEVNCDYINNFLAKLGFEYILSHGHNNLYKNKNL